MIRTYLIACMRMSAPILSLSFIFFATAVHAQEAADTPFVSAQMMQNHARSYKKYVKEVESKFKLLRGATKGMGWCPLGKWTIQNIARTFGYSEREIKHAKILSRFVDAGNAKRCALATVCQGKGFDVLTRVFSQLKNRFGVLRRTVEVRTALIDFLHQEMMDALGLQGSRDWFCQEIDRKNKKKQYIIRDAAFDIYLHQTALALFAMYWFENHIAQ